MEAPEKIYYAPYDDMMRENVPITDNDIEYIRKDAFIEKATDYIAKNMRCNGYTIQTKVKFIKDFKKYMHG